MTEGFTVEWSITSSDHAATTTIDADGLLKVAQGETAEDITVKAVAKVDGEEVASSSVEVAVTGATLNTFTITTTQQSGTNITTNGLVFTFDSDPGELEVADIKIESIDEETFGGAEPNVLSGTGLTRNLTIRDQEAGRVNVSIVKEGIVPTAQVVTINRQGWTVADFVSVTAVNNAGHNNTP